MRRLLLPVPLLLLLAAGLEAKPKPGPFKKIAIIRLREDPDEAIDPSVKQSVLRRIEQIREWGADCVILDIESYGGYVGSSIETGDELYALGREVHTIAYVGRKAVSGAAMLSLSCQEIVMHDVAKIGDSQAVYMGADGEMKEAPEKSQTVVAGTFRTYAEGNGYPVPIVESMVRKEMEVTRYRKRGDPPAWVYFRSDTPDGLPSRRDIEEQGLEDPEVVVREGELAYFTARQAMEYGLCSRIEPTVEALVKSISDDETQVLSLEWSWSERTSRFLLGYSWLLFLVGLGSLYFAFKMPGTGIPEAMAIICFGLFFGASAIAGFAGPLEMVLFLAGVILLVVEIFVLPGFGVAGFAGLACIFVAIGLAAIPDVTGKDEIPVPKSGFLFEMAVHFLAGALGSIALAFVLARFLPKVPLFRGLALAPAAPQTGSAVAVAPGAPPHALVGAAGVAETQLRPAGRARIDGKHFDVVAESGFVQPGTPVRVVAVRGNVITVRPEK
jgi:membrane-bound serine protease (ClpP class)